MDDQKKNSSQREVEGTIAILRQAGFFQQYDGLPAAEIYDSLHRKRIKQYSSTFGRPYDPGMDLKPYEIACLDERKMVYFDTEEGVMKENDVYVALIESFATASGGQMLAIQATEAWKSDKGPITVRFQSHGKTVVFRPEYLDDWVADELFHVVSASMQGNARFYVCQDEQTQLGCGQDVGIMRLTKEEMQKLEKAFAWKFHQL
jgi:hypothetical protein